MNRRILISLIAPAILAGLSACASQQAASVTREAVDYAPEYQGIDTRLLEGDLVNFQVAMTGARDDADVHNYAECAAAQYALIRGFGFARHLRTNVNLTDGIWHGDAVYTISPALPDGLKTIDAEVTVAHCEENGIPTV